MIVKVIMTKDVIEHAENWEMYIYFVLERTLSKKERVFY